MEFPPLQGPTVFLASPGDLKPIRADITIQFERRVAKQANPQELHLYAWEDAFHEQDFVHYLPAEAQIPLAADVNCKAMLAFFGERIGTPLQDWELFEPYIGEWRESSAGKLVMPWRPGAEDEGGFALTGTVFEVLAAMHANRQSGYERFTGKPPLEIWFYGDHTIIDADPMKANWGRCRLRAKVDAMPDLEKRLAAQLDYASQIKQLSNFRHFLNENGLFFGDASIVTSPQDALNKFFDFLSKRFILNSGSREGYPFKGLSHYDVHDEKVFFGRNQWIEESIHLFEQVWPGPLSSEEQLAPGPFFAIKGGSGSGKSSLLRAGMLARLERHTRTSSFTCIAVSADDLLASFHKPLESLTMMVLKTLHERTHAARRDVGEAAPPTRVPPNGVTHDEALDLICDVLARVHQGRAYGPRHGTRLVLGLDQFELLLDRHQTQPELIAPLFAFVAAACRSGRVGFLYTCQTNRLNILLATSTLCQINLAIGRPADFGRVVDGMNQETIGEIAEQSFDCIRVQLDQPVLRELKEKARLFEVSVGYRADPEDARSGLLPLFSLALNRLADFCQECRRATQAEWLKSNGLAESPTLAAPPTSAAGRFAEALSLDETLLLTAGLVPEELLNVGAAIEAQANKAFEEAEKFPGVDRDTLSQLLRRLVRIVTSETYENRYELRTTQQPEQGPLRQLIQSFLRRRLLVPSAADVRQVRLVHEAVLTHWTAARAWLGQETVLLEAADQLASSIKDWRRRGTLPAIAEDHVHAAALLLFGWEDVFQRADGTDITEGDRYLRDFALNLLDHAATPEARVDFGDRSSPHFLIACDYGRSKLVKKYLEMKPSLAVESRTAWESNAAIGAAHSCDLATLRIVLDAGAQADLPNRHEWQPVHYAAQSGSIECFDLLVERGAQANAFGPSQTTPLISAVSAGRVDMARHLIAHYKCDPNHQTAEGWDCLRTASNVGDARMAELLLNFPVDPAARGADGWSAFHHACGGQEPRIVNLLLKHPDNKPQDKVNEATPLHFAMLYGSPAVVEELLRSETIDRIGYGRQSALEMAANSGLECVRGLLADPHLGSAPPEGAGPALLAAVAGRDVPLVRLLLDAGTDPNFQGNHGVTPIIEAARKGFGEILRMLLAALGPEITADSLARDEDEETCLHLAARNGHEIIVDLLLEQPFGRQLRDQVSKAGQTALHFAAWFGHAGVVATLLPRRPGQGFLRAVTSSTEQEPAVDEVNVKDAQGNTPLHLAAERDHTAMMELLLDRGAAPELINAEGKTPLLAALRRGGAQAAMLLLKKGVRIDVKDSIDWTALHFAVSRGMDAVRSRLFERAKAEPASNLDVNAKTDQGITPLHMAAERGDVAAIGALLAEGAARELSDAQGRTPLLTAAAAGKLDAFNDLCAHRARLTAIDSEGLNALHHTVAIGFAPLYNQLLQTGTLDKDAQTNDRRTALYIAANRNDVDAIERLLHAGASLSLHNDQGASPLFAALAANAAEAAEALLRAGAQLQTSLQDGSTLLHAICKYDRPELLAQLLASGTIDVNAQQSPQKQSAAHIAAARQSPAMLQLLHAHGAALELRDVDGRTPLLAALAAGSSASARTLIEAGVDIHAVDRRRWNLLHHAVQHKLMDIVGEQLAGHAVDVNARTVDGQSLLHLAARGGLTELVHLLLGTEAMDPNAGDLDGRTPLQLAAHEKELLMVQALLDSDRVDIMAVSNTGRTALHYAAQVGAKEICRLLKNRMSEQAIAQRTHGARTAADLARQKGFTEIAAMLTPRVDALGATNATTH